MYRDRQVAVVIPAYNEQQLVGTTVSTLPSWVDRVIVVDDASEDGTAAAALAAAPQRAGFELLCHPGNRGVGAAIATGYRRALEQGADVAVVMGADAQMDPADLPRLLEPVVAGEADYAKGNRLRWPGVARIMPWSRFVGNWALTWLTRPVSGYWRITDSQCGYTAICCQALARLPLDRLYPRYGYPNDLLTWCNEAGLRVVDVPVRPIYGTEVSGIRVLHVVLPLLGLLLGLLARRLRSRWHRFRGERRALALVTARTPERQGRRTTPAAAPTRTASGLHAGKLPG